ncbi:MAG: DUF1800 domain-containing protein [Gemmobacter sp.]
MIPPGDLAAIRFGTGLPSGAADPAALLAGLTGPDPMLGAYPGPTLNDAVAFTRRGIETAQRSRKENTPDANQADKEVRRERRTNQLVTLRLPLARALDAPSGFRERLVQFWADHFTVVAKSGFAVLMPLAFADEAIRPHVAGRFADMLRAATLHPAMLQYLDQAQSVGPNSRLGRRRERGLNENLAREVIELHTLGVGAAYAQADVTQMAELLTGLSLTKDGFRFRPEQAEPGTETVLGVTYGGEGMDPILAVLDDIATRPDTAAHIARKLAVHFVSDTPDPGLVEGMTRAFVATDGDLGAVCRAMLDHPAAWGPDLAKARQPFDFMVAALRALGLDGARLTQIGDGPFRQAIYGPLAAMGQPWQTPRGPDGWPEAAEAWITPQLLAARVTWAMEVPSRLVPDLPEPVALVTRALGSGADARVAWAAARAETRAEGVGVVLASPMFNRR